MWYEFCVSQNINISFLNDTQKVFKERNVLGIFFMYKKKCLLGNDWFCMNQKIKKKDSDQNFQNTYKLCK